MARKSTLLGSAGIIPILIAGSSASLAQDSSGQVNEIVVTAQKRGENLQDVPIAVSAFTGEQLENSGLTSATELDKLTPGLTSTQGGGLFQPFIRGIGNPVIAVGHESSTALYVDGAYYARLPAAFFELTDVERIEVLKGPQGTLFGRNASGGLIHIITRDPTDAWEGKFTGGYGNYDTVRLTGSVGGPLAEGVKLRLSGVYRKQHDGWGKSLATGRDSYRDENRLLRGKLLFDLSDRTTATLVADYVWGRSDIDPRTIMVGSKIGNPQQPYFAYPHPGFYNTLGNRTSVRTDKGWGTAFTLKHEMDSLIFTGISTFRDEQGEAPNLDSDQTPVDYTRSELYYYNKMFTQELQLASQKDEKFDWIMGLYYLWMKGGYVPIRLSGVGFGNLTRDRFGEQAVNSYSAFAQGTYHFTENTNLTLGLRYSIDKLNAFGYTNITAANGVVTPGTIIRPHDSFKKLSYKATLDHKLTEDIMAYATISRGYKSGTYATTAVSRIVAFPEVANSYELGLKSELFDRKLRLNLAAFYLDLKNPQVSIVDCCPMTVIQNAGSARAKGVELESQLVLTRGLVLSAGLSYNNAKYKKYLNALFVDPNPNTDPTRPVGGNVTTARAGNASGNWMLRAPKLTFNTGASYHLDSSLGGFDFDVNLYHNDGFYWQPDNRLREGAYTIVNAAVGFTLPDSKYSIRVWGKNLFSSKYYQSNNANTGTVGDLATPGAPRTYGVTLSAGF